VVLDGPLLDDPMADTARQPVELASAVAAEDLVHTVALIANSGNSLSFRPCSWRRRDMDTIEITLPVTNAAAERLREPADRARLGALLSAAITSDASAAELAAAARLLAAPEPVRRVALREVFSEMQGVAAAAGITPDDVEKELAAWKQERATFRTGGETARRR
jgi:hypothetical protein